MTVWTFINRIYSTVCEPWFAVLAGLPETLQLFLTALPVTTVALLSFRYCSDQEGIATAKERIKAYLLELWLYKDDLRVMLGAQGAVFGYSLRYLALALLPVAIMLIPLAPVIAQLESHYAYRSLQPGESIILTALVGPDIAADVAESATLSVPPELAVQTPALFLRDQGKLLWRIGASQPGEFSIGLELNGTQASQRVLVEQPGRPLWPAIYRADDWHSLGSPVEQALSPDSAIAQMTLDYPPARDNFGGLSSATWILFLFTLIIGFALRNRFGVTF